MFLEQFYPDMEAESSYKIHMRSIIKRDIGASYSISTIHWYLMGQRRTKKPLPFLKDCGRSAFPAASFPIIMSQESSPLLTR